MATTNPKDDTSPEVERHVDEMMEIRSEQEAVPDQNKPAPVEEIAPPPDATADADPLVEDIVAEESDQLLAAQDAESAKVEMAPEKLTFQERVQEIVQAWWDNKPLRYGTIGALAVVILVLSFLPVTRYFVLNTVGVRSSASLTILDNTTDLPLKNVAVSLSGKSGKTNQDGVVRLSGLKLGPHDMTVERLGFAAVHKQVTLGLGSNPLGEFGLQAVGTQLKFAVTDYLSGKPLTSAEATSGEASAQADDKGNIILTVGEIGAAKIDVIVTAGGYRSDKISVSTEGNARTNVALVTKRKEVFVSKQNGTYDVYKIDVDGKNKKVVLAGSGLERPQIALVPQPIGNMVALVSSRENKRNKDGYLLDTLTIINIDDGTSTTVESSERIQIIDWVKNKVIYLRVKAGASAGNPERVQMISYDSSDDTRLQLASANNFSDVVSTKGSIYYAASNNYSGGQSQFVKINPDNSGKQVLHSGEIWSIYRKNYEELDLAGGYTGNTQNWFSYHLGDSQVSKLTAAPNTTDGGKFYIDAPDYKRAAWTDFRDGKGVLLTYDQSSKRDAVITDALGLSTPLHWLDARVLVYRVITPRETALYAVSLDGGTPHKVTDITATTGLSRNSYGY